MRAPARRPTDHCSDTRRGTRKGTMSTSTRVWVNGELVDPTGPSVSALDHSVTVGDGVFETAKIDAGRPFALTRHHRRLERSAAGLGLPPLDLPFIDKGIGAVLDGP